MVAVEGGVDGGEGSLADLVDRFLTSAELWAIVDLLGIDRVDHPVKSRRNRLRSRSAWGVESFERVCIE
jgi:hypothetical protein